MERKRGRRESMNYLPSSMDLSPRGRRTHYQRQVLFSRIGKYHYAEKTAKKQTFTSGSIHYGQKHDKTESHFYHERSSSVRKETSRNTRNSPQYSPVKNGFLRKTRSGLPGSAHQMNVSRLKNSGCVAIQLIN